MIWIQATTKCVAFRMKSTRQVTLEETMAIKAMSIPFRTPLVEMSGAIKVATRKQVIRPRAADARCLAASCKRHGR